MVRILSWNTGQCDWWDVCNQVVGGVALMPCGSERREHPRDPRNREALIADVAH